MTQTSSWLRSCENLSSLNQKYYLLPRYMLKHSVLLTINNTSSKQLIDPAIKVIWELIQSGLREPWEPNVVCVTHSPLKLTTEWKSVHLTRMLIIYIFTALPGNKDSWPYFESQLNEHEWLTCHGLIHRIVTKIYFILFMKFGRQCDIYSLEEK